jgi:hypothetical protein
MRRPELHGLLEGPLADVCMAGWSIEWVGVRRRLNLAADALATEGVMWAAELAESGNFNTSVRWYSS